MSARLSASERLLVRIGTVVGQYRLERIVGTGGIATVYAATHPDGRRVAIKLLLERYRDDADVGRLFAREAHVANYVTHPGAVPVLDQGVDRDGCPFLVMPLLEGETLLARWERGGKRLSVAEVGVLLAETLDVLACAHARGIVHRDIKPANLFITSTGELKVLDFGIARHVDAGHITTATGIMIGTPTFMPPEQALGKREAIGPQSDVWAVGATIFTLLSGEFVHATGSAPEQLAAAATRRARSLAEANPNLPASLIRFVDRALAFDPADRWPSADEMRSALLEAFETVLGDPVPMVANRVRAALAVELARELEKTEVRKQPHTPDHTEVRAPAGWDLSGIETRAIVHLGPIRLLPADVERLFVKHGLASFAVDGSFQLSTEPWWPLDRYLATLHEINDVIGSVKMTEISRLVFKYVDVPHATRDIHTAFEAMDASYHLRYRKEGLPMFDVASGRMLEGIGHHRYRGEPGLRFIAVEFDTPYPCAVDLGMTIELARRFETHVQIEHAPGPCRQTGAASCIYHVSWR